MPPTDPRNNDGEPKKGAVFAVFAIAVAAAPFVTDANTGWFVFSFGIAIALGLIALTVTSGESFDGETPLRRG
jgi:hypothetical protein